MSRLKWFGLPLGAACLLVLALTGTFWAQDTKSVAAKHDARFLRDSLKDVINNGADLFNKDGDHAGCYRLYQGALLSIKPFLAPTMQKEIDNAIAEAEKLPRFSDRAFALRKTIDDIRAQAAQAPPVIADKKAADKKTEAPKTTLWDRLGGEANVRKVVDDFAKAAAADPKVNVTRDGKYKLDEVAVEHLKKQLVDFISSATGGPLKYHGKSMKEVHKGMGITNGEYNAAGKHLKKALEMNGARAEDVAELMKAVDSLRKDIVEGKKKKEASKDAPKTDAPKKDSPKSDAPKRDGPKADAPKKDVAKVEVPKVEVPKVVVSEVKVPKVEVPKVVVPKVEIPKTAKISGQVVFEGKAAPAGYFTLVSPGDRRYSTFINQDGTYGFRTAIPAGMYKVAIERAFGQKASQPEIPARYRNEATSGLILEVRSGEQVLNVILQK